MGKIIDGTKIAKSYKEEIKKFTDKLISDGKRVPCAAAIIVGNDGGSSYYLKSVMKNCSVLGVTIKDYRFPQEVTEQELEAAITNLNNDKNVDGIMLFLPLPKHINSKHITSLISYKKDIDCLTDLNNGKFYKGEESFIPCTPNSVVKLIENCGMDMEGKNAVILGRSNIVGKPLVQLLLQKNCTVTVCHSKTKELSKVCSNADILISCTGKPGLVTKEFLKEGAVVIDVGTTSVNGKITGDVVFEEVIEKASYITPVPGGVGAVTTTMLIRNICEAYRKNVY
ncbi:bifunctional 5,10-methylenetetrahydrofolate dehydrogenase/5,10-methenyltetrahydrofolate cyclohydrolase [Clostridium oryzae]|uniref:Bifunctional protein FolD n=1 Tax=Clostridium oryzae TaxID=1450648 RepID=A0A1V4IT52_9CLOT|nr:tetrahydrofolate dehydrogenase/cyclohydrolase catalytic domain-containing protein [Clostridium oryzae]OPJ63201.1 bifunctional protein FolD protein [Clostridium oryzae]